MRKVAKAIGVGEEIIKYVRNNGRDYVRRFEQEFEDGKARGGARDKARERVKGFFIKWC